MFLINICWCVNYHALTNGVTMLREEVVLFISHINEKLITKASFLKMGLVEPPKAQRGLVRKWLKNKDKCCFTSKYIMELIFPSKLRH